MYLLLIFALTFTLSTQLEDNDRMLERFLRTIGEEGLAQLMNSLEDSKLDILMDCLEQECTDEKFLEIISRVLEIIKGINGGKAGYLLIKEFIKKGYLYYLVIEVREEVIIKIFNELSAKLLDVLIHLHEGQTKVNDIVELGKKLLPIIEKFKSVEKVAELIKTIKNAEQTLIEMNNRRRSNNQGGRNGGRGMRNSGGRTRSGNNQGGGQQMSLADLLAGMNGGGRSQMPGMQGGGGGGTQGDQQLANLLANLFKGGQS